MSDELKCLRCQGDMQSVGQMSFVTGGHSAAAKLFFGQLAEMDEKNIPLNVYRCTGCHKIELFDAAS